MNTTDTNNSNSEDNIFPLKKGEILFEKGEKGGSVFLIIEGEIQIFTVKECEEIELARMKPGEVIGTVTCLTNSQRFASVKAYTDSTLKEFTPLQFKSMIDNLPKWIKIIVKDITNRISSMNEKYIDATFKIAHFQNKESSYKYTARQLASSIATLSIFVSKEIDEKKGVLPEDILPLVSETLNLDQSQLTKIFNIFSECGLLKLIIDPKKGKKYFTLKNAQLLSQFSNFIKDSSHGNTKKLLKMKLSPKQKRMISSLIRYVTCQKLNTTSNHKLLFKELEENFYNKTTTKFNAEIVRSLGEISLFEVQGNAGDEYISFVPSEVSKTIAHISAIDKIIFLEDKSEELDLDTSEKAS